VIDPPRQPAHMLFAAAVGRVPKNLKTEACKIPSLTLL
jgi:hypothetical protein